MPEPVLVFPGDEVAVAEEFLAGPGTYEENGTVYAARMGHVRLDANEFVAHVDAVTSTPVTLKVGDLVIGTVESVRGSMAIVQVQRTVEHPHRNISGDTNGTLHVSRTADYYLERLEDAFRLKDILRAEVTQVEPSIQLTTRAPHLGVVKAYCPRDRTPMVRAAGGRSNGLVCPDCEWKMVAKLAEDFGQGHVAFHGEIRERGDREERGGGGRGERGDRGGRGFGGDRGRGRGFGGDRGRGRGFGGDRGRGGRGGDRGGRGYGGRGRGDRPRRRED